MAITVKPNVYKIFLREDKHGNKTYRSNMCKRCGGTGYINFSSVDGSRCWRCGATGVVKEYKTVEYTPEQDKLRREKARAKKLGSLEDQFKAMGFNSNGVGFILKGNTYPIKDRIKADGGRYNSFRGWIMPFKPDYWTDFEEVHAVINDMGEYFKYQSVSFPPLNVKFTR